MSDRLQVQAFLKSVGFSLVELLVVLLLMGLVTSLAFPRIQSALLAYKRDTMEEKLFIFLRQEVAKSNLTGIPFSVPKGATFQLIKNEDSNRIELSYLEENSQPSGTLHYLANLPIHINSNGLCANTNVSLVFESASRELSLIQPFCEKS